MINCPICDAESKHYHPIPRWGEMRQCSSCGFVFANPMVLQEKPETLYERAYTGGETRAEMLEYNRRLLMADYGSKDSLPAATMLALKYLDDNIPQGSTVFTIGCGFGYFMEALNNLGFLPIGLEVSKSLVEYVSAKGYKVWHGVIESVPDGWVEPQAVVCLNVLHHLQDPMGFLKTIKAKYPQAVLFINQANGKDSDPKYALPPRTLSKWEPYTLKLAMNMVGYSTAVTVPPRMTNEYGISALAKPYLILSRVLPLDALLRTYYKVKPYLLAPLVMFGRLKGRRGSMLAIGYPGK